MRDSITSAVASMKCIKLDGQARCQPIMAWRVQIFDNVWLVQSFGDPNVIIGCLPPEVLAPSPGTKSLDVNSVLRGCTSKFLVEDVPTHKGLTVHTCILKKNKGVFSLSWIFLIVYRNPEAPKNIFPSRTAWVRAATACGQAKQKAEGKQVLDLPITFPALKRRAVRSARCFVDVSSDSWNNENDECMVCMKMI